MKHEWRKHEKQIYNATTSPARLTIPPQQFLILNGSGDPNAPDFSERVSALYTTAYAVKRLYRAGVPADAPFHDFTVYPLEGLWTQDNDGPLNKSALHYRIMIRQPEAITQEMVTAALAQASRKKPNPHYDAIRFETLTDGDCVQILHIGSYDDEPASFAKLDAYLQEKSLSRTTSWHREIYLSNAQRIPQKSAKPFCASPCAQNDLPHRSNSERFFFTAVLTGELLFRTIALLSVMTPVQTIVKESSFYGKNTRVSETQGY